MGPVVPVIVGGLISLTSTLIVTIIAQVRESRKVAISNSQKIYVEILIPKLFHPLLLERALCQLDRSRSIQFGTIHKVIIEHVAYLPLLRDSTSKTLHSLLSSTKNYSGSSVEKQLILDLLEDLFEDLHAEFSIFRGDSILWTIARQELQS